jgi:Spy/CpxP family protein refolding chaperone
MNRVLIGCAALALLLVAGAAAAQPMAMPADRWWERPAVAQQLGLSPDQTKKLEDVYITQARAMVDLKAVVEKAGIDLRAAAEAEPFDAAKVRAGFTAFQQARVKLDAQRFEALLKVHEVLSLDQWHKLRDLLRTVRGERRGMGRGPAGAGQGPSGQAGPRQWQPPQPQ